ncbi:hypothetical protein ACWGMO_15835 [Nocardia salmonicida]
MRDLDFLCRAVQLVDGVQRAIIELIVHRGHRYSADSRNSPETNESIEASVQVRDVFDQRVAPTATTPVSIRTAPSGRITLPTETTAVNSSATISDAGIS